MAKKILFVDDEEDILDIFKSRISSWGYDVAVAINGKIAMKILKEEEINAIVLDYLMPDTDGIVLLKKIRGIYGKMPVIMFTAYPKEVTMEDAEKLNIAAFIPKISPYTSTIDSLKTALEIIFKREK